MDNNFNILESNLDYAWDNANNWTSVIRINTSNTIIQVLDPKKIWNNKIEQISNTFREMWSSEYWLQELVHCHSCHTILSKKDIFWYLQTFIYDLNVWDIMKILGMKDILCPCCRNKTQFIYGSEYTDNIRKRLLHSLDSFLVIAENNWNPVWWLLWYMPNSFEEMYQLEFKDHYSNIGVEKIKNKARMIIDWEYKNILMFAAVGFLDKYRNLFQLIEFLQLAYTHLPKEHYGLPWIMELDKNNIMHKLFSSIGWVSLDIWGNDSVGNTGKNYRSDIVILPNASQVFWEYFWPNVPKRKILKLLQWIK